MGTSKWTQLFFVFQIHGKRKEISLERESKSRHPERDRRSWDTERKKEKIKQKKSSLVADCFLYIRANVYIIPLYLCNILSNCCSAML